MIVYPPRRKMKKSMMLLKIKTFERIVDTKLPGFLKTEITVSVSLIFNSLWRLIAAWVDCGVARKNMVMIRKTFLNM